MHFDTLDYHHYCFIIYAYIIWYHWRSIYNHLALITMDSLTLYTMFLFFIITVKLEKSMGRFL